MKDIKPITEPDVCLAWSFSARRWAPSGHVYRELLMRARTGQTRTQGTSPHPAAMLLLLYTLGRKIQTSRCAGRRAVPAGDFVVQRRRDHGLLYMRTNKNQRRIDISDRRWSLTGCDTTRRPHARPKCCGVRLLFCRFYYRRLPAHHVSRQSYRPLSINSGWKSGSERHEFRDTKIPNKIGERRESNELASLHIHVHMSQKMRLAWSWIFYTTETM